MTQLASAIERLASVAEAQLQTAREQLRHDRERSLRERQADPWFRAQMQAARRPLRRLSPVAFMRACPEAFACFEHVVPGSFYIQLDTGRFTVACPCGTDHEVAASGPSGAECGRYFMLVGDELRVAFSPKGTEPLPEEPPEPFVD